ncbi:SpoIID/LytB domain-containing protein [Oxynema aestuarii]|uniref:SpoIID/LytB domain-containing protein n=1 Tax=Oxynema aestuarii AP17 TaxID=2064643 RepID=A0A6H1TXA0_9CYAN|nr:SpoIID/LytB domain-containing protein [Oxynema aestuarii]QIZ71045.1 SpoIID/LytB domain-containing protein [Oxynema aestuarii AP17]
MAHNLLFPVKKFRVKLKFLWWMWLAIGLMMAAPAQASLLLKVAIEENVDRVKVGSSTPAMVRDSNGRNLGQLDAMRSFYAQSNGAGISLQQWQGNSITIDPENDGYVYIGDRWYRGHTILVPTDGGLTAVNAVDLEEYLYSVVGAEMSPSWPSEALKAQAVAARSYVLYQRQHRGNAVYDVGDDTYWQVYSGLEKEATTTHKAVQETAGQVLTHDGQIIEAVFHSSSGGHTENVEDVWSETRPYLRGVPDFDAGAPVYEWKESFSSSQLSGLISGVGNVLSLNVEAMTPQGRVVRIRAIGDAGERSLDGEAFRQALDLRSARFTVLPQYGSATSKENANAIPTGFLLDGRGFGHGIGMSQWGAYHLAHQGANYQQILLHYYQNSSLAKIKVE